MAEQITKKRCAIYTRKSTDENLSSDFNSLDAQREACENYIRSQIAKGWQILPERYDDGGFSGGNMKRPALQRLLEDCQAPSCSSESGGLGRMTAQTRPIRRICGSRGRTCRQTPSRAQPSYGTHRSSDGSREGL